MFNAHYDERCFLPIHVYDADTGHCVLTILRPGKTPDGKEVSAHLRPVGATHPGCIGQTPASPSVATVITADEKRWTGASRTASTISSAPLSTNAVLAARRSSPKTDDVCVIRRATGNLDVVRDYTETRYAAKSWLHLRRVVARIEATRKGLDVRYVVTNIAYGAAAWLYDGLYCARGQAENLIKRHKSQLASDRTSCRSPLANQMRLILHTAAYWLMLKVRGSIPCMANRWPAAEFSTIRLRFAEDCCADQRDYDSDQAGVRCQLPRFCTVPWIDRCADPAPNVNGGANAPVKPRLINLQRLADTARNAVKSAAGGACTCPLSIRYDMVAGWFGE